MVCCAAVDTAGAAPGLDWLDGPALLVGGERRADLAGPVLSLVEDGDAGAAACLARGSRRPPGEAGPTGLTRVRPRYGEGSCAFESGSMPGKFAHER